MSRILNTATEPVVALLAAFFTGLLMVSVFSRYVLDISIVESVELTRIAFLWAVSLAAAVVVGRNAHIRITVLADLAPPAGQEVLRRVVHLVAATFGAAMVWQGWLLTLKMTITTLPALGISQAWLYGALPVSGALIVVHSLCHAIDPPPPVALA